MAITKLNSLAIPDDTIVEADLSYPLTNFSSTGIDDNADATAITIDSSERVGIGIADPSQRLQIKSSEAQTNISVWNSGTAAYGRYAQLLLTHGSTFFGAHDKSWQFVSEGQTDGTTLLQIQNWNGSAYTKHATFYEDGNVNLHNGVRFGSDTLSANVLDDYEEGTWTPTAVQGLTGLTVDTGNCTYTKIGNTVHVRAEVHNFTGTGSSALTIGGLPFTVANGIECSFAVMFQQINLDSGYTSLAGYIAPNTNNFRLYESGDAVNFSAIRGNQCGSSTDLIFGATYQAA
jgi:hypothetical protein